MTLQSMYPADIRLRLAAGEVSLAASRLDRTVGDPQTRHELPRALAELNAAHETLFALAQEIAPEAFQALAAGLASTHDLPPPDLIAIELEPAHD